MENKTSRKKATPKKPSRPNPAYKYSSIAIKMIVIILAGTLGGVKLDEITAIETPIFTLILSLVSVGLAMWIIIRDITK